MILKRRKRKLLFDCVTGLEYENLVSNRFIVILIWIWMIWEMSSQQESIQKYKATVQKWSKTIWGKLQEAIVTRAKPMDIPPMVVRRQMKPRDDIEVWNFRGLERPFQTIRLDQSCKFGRRIIAFTVQIKCDIKLNLMNAKQMVYFMFGIWKSH